MDRVFIVPRRALAVCISLVAFSGFASVSFGTANIEPMEILKFLFNLALRQDHQSQLNEINKIIILVTSSIWLI